MLDFSQHYFDTTDIATMRRAYDSVCDELGLDASGDDALRRDHIASLIANIAEPRDGDWLRMKQRVMFLLKS